jgi:raffinose/stachyose/melibiose transport system substrate-binding protein
MGSIYYFNHKRRGIMKKKLLSVILSAAMISTMLVGCGESAEAPAAASSAAPVAATSAAAAATSAAPAAAATSEAATAASSGDIDPGTGKVYMLNFKPETDEAWQALAKTYTDKYGVEVNVLTAADGQYSTTLQSEMAKTDAPTIFTVGNTTAAQTWDDYTADLKDSYLYNHLTDKSLVINYNNKVAAIANCYECYGIIYNKTLLNDYCQMSNAKIKSVDDIKDFATLKAVADDIQSRLDEFNKQFGTELTGAFASAGLDDGSSWRFSGHLAGLPLYYEFKDDGCDLIGGEEKITGKYLDNFKNVWDMYVKDSGADPATLNSGSYNAEEEFGMQESVFYQNGDWEYAGLTNADNGYTVKAEDLGMMPIYFGVDDANEGLAAGTENYWAINAKASADDQKSSLAFLQWVISSDEGRDAVTNTMGLTAPFDTFTGDYETTNPFFKDCNALMAAGKTSVAWSFNATPNVDDWRKGVVDALVGYEDGSGNWDAVKKAFVDGWSEQWALAHADDAK